MTSTNQDKKLRLNYTNTQSCNGLKSLIHINHAKGANFHPTKPPPKKGIIITTSRELPKDYILGNLESKRSLRGNRIEE